MSPTAFLQHMLPHISLPAPRKPNPAHTLEQALRILEVALDDLEELPAIDTPREGCETHEEAITELMHRIAAMRHTQHLLESQT